MEYGSVDLDLIEEDEEELQQEEEERKRRRTFWSPKEGDTTIRVMPPPKGQKRPHVKVWIHKVKNPNNPSAFPENVVCAAKQANQKCVACERVAELRATGHKADADAAFELSSQHRYFLQIGLVDDPDVGVKVWEFGKKVYTQYLAAMKEGDITHPEQGFNLVVKRKGKTKTDTEYTLTVKRRPSPMINPKWLEEMRDVQGMVTELLTEEKVTALIEGREEEEGNPSGTAEDDVGQ